MIVVTTEKGEPIALSERHIDGVYPREKGGCAIQVTSSDHRFECRESLAAVLEALEEATGKPTTWASRFEPS